MNYREAKSLGDYAMSLSEIRDWYGRARSDYWYKTQMPVSDTSLGTASELNSKTIWDVINEDAVPLPETIEKLETTINKIERREIIWCRGRQNNGFVFFHNTELKERPRRAKLSRNHGFDVFALCASCQSNKWVPVKIDGKEHIVCYSCIPPNQWLALGAEGINRSLIRDYIEGKTHA